jgi:hypothetical protein
MKPSIRIVHKRARVTASPGTIVCDLTSSSGDPKWRRFSPFFPHGGFVVPFCRSKTGGEVTSSSVEGIWQGLKEFEEQGVDFKKFTVTNLKSIKRSVRTSSRRFSTGIFV